MKNYQSVLNRLTLEEKVRLLFIIDGQTGSVEELGIDSLAVKKIDSLNFNEIASSIDLNLFTEYTKQNVITDKTLFFLDAADIISDNYFYNTKAYEYIAKAFAAQQFLFIANMKLDRDNVVYFYDKQLPLDKQEFMAIEANDYESTIEALQNGACFVFISNRDIEKELVSNLEDMLNKYDAFMSEEITEEEYQNYLAINRNKTVDLDTINKAVNKVLDILASTYQVQNELVSEFSRKLLAKQINEDGLVLLKNDNLLPLTNNLRVAFLGNLFTQLYKKVEFTNLNVTFQDNCWENDGFVNDLKLKQIIEKLIDIDVVVLLLDCHNLEKLNNGQKRVVDILKENQKKVVIVLETTKNFDMTELNVFASLIYLPQINANTGQILNETLTGVFNPSGHLFKQLGNYDCFAGLSYNSFAYNNLIVRSDAISFTCANKSNHAVICSFNVYVKGGKQNTIYLALQKVKINGLRTEKVYIEISETLSAGDYKLYVSNGSRVILEGTIQIEQKETPTYEVREFSEILPASLKVSKPTKARLVGKVIFALLITIFCVLIFISMYQYSNSKIGYLALAFAALSGCTGLGYLVHLCIQTKKTHVPTSEAIDMRKCPEFINEIRESFTAPLSKENLVPIEKEHVIVEKPKEADFTINETYSGQISNVNFTAFSKDFLAYLANSGLITTYSDVCSLLAAMGMTRLIVLKPSELNIKFCQLLSNFFGIDYNYVNYDENNHMLYKQLNKAANSYMMTGLAETLLKAGQNPNQMYISVIEASTAEISQVLSEEIANINSNVEKHYLNLAEYNRFIIPRNIWYFVIVPETNLELNEVGVNLSLKLEWGEDTGKIYTFNPKNLIAFKEEVKLARHQNYLPDKYWQMLDLFVAEVKNKTDYELSHRIILSMEAYTAIYYELTGDADQTLDVLLTNKLLPIVKQLGYYSSENKEEHLKELLEKCFPDISLPNAVREIN